jgi:hypothetical protein
MPAPEFDSYIYKWRSIDRRVSRCGGLKPWHTATILITSRAKASSGVAGDLAATTTGTIPNDMAPAAIGKVLTYPAVEKVSSEVADRWDIAAQMSESGKMSASA